MAHGKIQCGRVGLLIPRHDWGVWGHEVCGVN